MKQNRIRAYGRFFAGFPGYLNRQVSPEEARQGIRERMELRSRNFLALAGAGIYGNPRSPYLKLLDAAGCTFDDLSRGVQVNGLEAQLQLLLDAGVWISAEEFKGLVPIKRGSTEFHVLPEDFENPGISGGIRVSTGGTSGKSAKTRLDLDFLAARALYDRVMFDMLELKDAPMALWYPALPASTGIGNMLRYARVGYLPSRWFEMAGGSGAAPGLESRLATGLITRLGRLAGTRLPFPEPVPMDSTEPITDQLIAWLEEFGSCVFQSYVSQAVRIAGELKKRRSNLAGLVMIVGSEPLTRAKKKEIEATGARVYPRYAATEIGTIGMGCGNPDEDDELHLLSDMVAAVQDDASPGGHPKPLYLTSLNPVMPRVMLNAQLGDMALVRARDCGCAFEKLGFTTHLSRVRSYARYTGAGMAVTALSMERIIEDVLVLRHGGTSLDYQLVEMENSKGRTEVRLRVSPEVGEVDEGRVVHDLLQEFLKGGEGERLMAELWRQAGMLSVVREKPYPTGRGKIVPLLKEYHS